MRYLIILSSYVLLAVSSPVTNTFSSNVNTPSKADELFNGDGKGVGEGTHLIDRKQSLGAANRHRRSIWTEIIDHIAAAAETFHMKPALAEGIAEVEDFNKQLNSKLRDRSKSVNAMLKKGADDSLASDVKVAEKSKNGKRKVAKKGKKAAVESKISKKLKTAQKVEKKINKLSNSLVKEIYKLKKLHLDVADKENKLLGDFAERDWDDIEVTDLAHLYTEGASSPFVTKIMHKMIPKFPSMKDEFIEGLERFRKIREDLLKQDEELIEKMSHVDFGEIGKDPKMEIEILIKRNRDWLKNKQDPEFKKKSGEKTEKKTKEKTKNKQEEKPKK